VIEVVNAGRWTTIQDRGRPGRERFGIPPGGAADWFAAAAANRLVGNHPNAALLECTAMGASLRFDSDVHVAVTGARAAGIETWVPQVMARGATLAVGAIGPGLRTYVAVRGGIDVPVVLGSRSFCQRGAFGGGFGRPLAHGDRFAAGTLIDGDPLPTAWPAGHRLPMGSPWEVRVIGGPHTAGFDGRALQRLSAVACRVSPELDRMGMRLETPSLRLHGNEIITVPITAGAIQVTPSGELIVSLADHPTTGGYPVIATVITADLPLLAQARPGDTVRFREVDRAEADRAWRRLAGWLEMSG